MFARIVLVVAAATFAFFGVAYLVDPVGMTAVVDLVPASATARADIRAVYGGLELALAGWLLAKARHRNDVAEGLTLAAVVYAGLGGGRAMGLLLDGEASGTSLRILGAELFAALGCAVALLVERRRAAR